MYCGTCGERIKNGEKICPFCGSEQTTLPQWKGISLDFISDKEENLSLIDQLKVQKKLTEKIENQKNRYKLYMELFTMLEEDDRKYMLKQILRNIECDMREKGIYAENKKEIDRLKKEIENGIEYDF